MSSQSNVGNAKLFKNLFVVSMHTKMRG